jgi:predicted Zn-dependent peptidase
VIEKTVLPNGVRILTEVIPHAFSVTVGAWMGVGSRDESVATGGVSHFIEHMAFKGTSKRGPLDIAREIDRLGGQANAFTSKESTCFHARALPEHLPDVVDLLLDILLKPSYDPVELERERQVILQEISSVEDAPEELVHVLFSNRFWADHPLGRPILGSNRSVSQLSRDDILAYLRESYSPEGMVVAAVGALEHQQMVDLVAPSLSLLPESNGRAKRLPGTPNSGVFVKARDSEQAHILMGMPAPSATDENRFGVGLLNLMLGGNMSSRLFQEVREKKGLAYAVYSYLSSYSDSGMLGIYMGVDPQRAGESVQVVMDQLKVLAKGLLEQKELRMAKDSLRSSILLSAENPESRMGRLARNEFNFGRDLPLEEIMAKIEVVDLDCIHLLAREILNPDKICLTALGPLTPEDLNWTN